jgi:hypothetical protein
MHVIAKTTFFPGGFGGRRVDRGTSYPDDHPIVKTYPGMFVTPDEWAAAHQVAEPTRGAKEPPVEQATAAPGEKRPTRRRK